MHRVPDLLLGLDMRGSFASGFAFGALRGVCPQTLSLRIQAALAPLQLRAMLAPLACAGQADYYFLRPRARQFTKLLIYGQRDQIIHRSAAMRIARHDQAESLIFHRLAV